jgi:predicted transcriptional regulator
MVRSSPGIHIRKLAQLMGLSWNTCLHHLRNMEAQGHVVSRKVQGRVCYFDRSQGAVQGKEAVCLLRDPDNRRLAQHIMTTPGQKQVEIARALSLATSTVHRRVARMEDAGLVERLAGARSMHVFPSQSMQPMARDAGLLHDDEQSSPLGPAGLANWGEPLDLDGEGAAAGSL